MAAIAPFPESHEPKPLTTMADIEKVFAKFDVNHDGRISVKELGTLLRTLGSDATKEEVVALMREMDANGDGSIDLKEFAAFNADEGSLSSGSQEEANSKELKEAFDVYDKDKNGLISARELHDVLKKLGEKCSVKDCSKMIRLVDVDGDGSVNFEEFKKMMTNN